MESQLVPAKGLPFEAVQFGGVRGKGLLTLALLPWRLLHAFWQSLQVIRRLRPDVLVGLGGYITFPGGMMGVLMGKPLVLHEQNSVAGMANKVLAHVADRVLCTFPKVLPKAQWVGNPMRDGFLNQAPPEARFAHRSGPLRVVVVGGSLGAQALNSGVPQALALMPLDQRPQVLHQGGVKHLQTLQDNYAQAAVDAELVPFIDDTASAFAQADLVICRAGASTVSELAAVGVAALLVPFPHAVDDHQTVNAQFLVSQAAGWMMPQSELTPEHLAAFLSRLDRAQLLHAAKQAYAVRKTTAAADVVQACAELVS
jgi:UDP-N-acetylglucosamine--N-acetylmuramyl-(pentapeptide) pyrophosphoryl-undecaprenol N-acetylglucosamine transferase